MKGKTPWERATILQDAVFTMNQRTLYKYCVFHRKNSGTQEPRNRSRRCSSYYYNKWSTGNFVLCPCSSVLCRVKGPNVERVTILLEDTIKDLQSMTAVWRFWAGRRVIILAGITELDPQEELDCCYKMGARRSTCRTQPSHQRTFGTPLPNCECK